MNFADIAVLVLGLSVTALFVYADMQHALADHLAAENARLLKLHAEHMAAIAAMKAANDEVELYNASLESQMASLQLTRHYRSGMAIALRRDTTWEQN